ncbi:MAG TPA: hypothetical protein VMT20_14365 [Terriglobia bacterium]|nr:hypothetical protein [Terriglobia bacterium]
MIVVRLLVVLSLLCPLGALASDQCSGQQGSVETLRSAIRVDENRIRELNTGLTADELQNWGEASERERQQILVKSLTDAAMTLWGGILDQGSDLYKTAALKPMDIFGYHLPNGIASLGPGPANGITGALEERGVTPVTPLGAALITSIRQAGLMRDKAKAIQLLSQVPSTLVDTGQMGDSLKSQEYVDAAGAAFQVAADIAGKGNFEAAMETALFKGAKNLADAWMISKAVGSLGNAAGAQLQALRVYSGQLGRHVHALQNAKLQLETCTAENQQLAGKQAQPAPAARAGQAYQQAAWKAAEAETRCEKAVNACQLACPLGPQVAACQTACGNCNQELAAMDKANKALQDFNDKQLGAMEKRLQNSDPNRH